MIKRHIVIVGFMGCGKTTVAQALAARLDCEGVDLDQVITQQHRRTPQEIIANDGEDAFREIESDVLRDVLTSKGPCVIAAGGGAWIIDDNRNLIRENGATTIWLNAPFDLCWQRIQDGQTRPLARTKEAASELFDQRSRLYALADLHISISQEKTAPAVADEIVESISSYVSHI